MAVVAETTSPMMMAWTATNPAARSSFSPMRRATRAVAPMLSPRATTKIRVSAVSVRPTVATASAPRRDTQKTSTTPKSDSMHISSTMGTASRMMARPMLPSVKSWLEPITASRREDHRLGVRGWIAVLVSLIRNPQDF